MTKRKLFGVWGSCGRAISGLLTEAEADLLVDQLNKKDGFDSYYNEEEDESVTTQMTWQEAIDELK